LPPVTSCVLVNSIITVVNRHYSVTNPFPQIIYAHVMMLAYRPIGLSTSV
jgi:hypothetical protein